jgi:hypothetical protein
MHDGHAIAAFRVAIPAYGLLALADYVLEVIAKEPAVFASGWPGAPTCLG